MRTIIDVLIEALEKEPIPQEEKQEVLDQLRNILTRTKDKQDNLGKKRPNF